MIEVAFIDDGINSRASNIQHYKDINHTIIRTNDFDVSLHGDQCYQIFNDYTQNYSLHSIKILNKDQVCDINSLRLALLWCMENDIEVINISLGSTLFSDYYILEDVIRELTKAGIIVVAACSNSNVLTYPASMRGVIGVRCDKIGDLDAKEIHINKKDIKGIQITVGALDAIYKGVGNSNSFVTPYITAIICNLLNGGCKDYSEIINSLCNISSDNDFINFEYEKRTLNIWANYEPLIICLKAKDESKYLIQKFQRLLIDKGYNTIIITDEIKGMTPFIYNTNDYQYLRCAGNNSLEYLIMNITRPDIILTTNFRETDQEWIKPDCCFVIEKNSFVYPELSKHMDSLAEESVTNDNEVLIKDIGKYQATIQFEGKEQTIRYQLSDDVVKDTLYVNIGEKQLLQDETIDWLENNF